MVKDFKIGPMSDATVNFLKGIAKWDFDFKRNPNNIAKDRLALNIYQCFKHREDNPAFDELCSDLLEGIREANLKE